MRRTVVVSEPAENQILTIEAWWRDNRPAAPHLFEQELGSAFEAVATHPGIGARVRDRRVPGLRRALLRATRYPVYYVATDQELVILAVWNAVRGSGPPLSAG